MSLTRIEEENNKEVTIFDSGAAAHYYLTAFDKESPNDGRSQEHQIIIATGVALSKELLAIGTLVQPADQRPQTYTRTTTHV